MVDGAVETVTTYEPYGNLLAQTGTSGTTYGFTGEQHDAATGLLYLRARYYNQALRIFMGKDMWQGNAQRPMSYNPWLYVYANPVNYTDPSGFCLPEGDNGECVPPDRTSPVKLIRFDGEPGQTWTASEKYVVNRAAIEIGIRLAKTYNEFMSGIRADLPEYLYDMYYSFGCQSNERPLLPREAFLYYYGRPALFYKTGEVRTYYGEYVSLPSPRIEVHKFNLEGTIGYYFDRPRFAHRWATHELGYW
jgi:RHS repeat-associated protein